MKMLLRLYGLDTEKGMVDEYACVMEVESPEEAEENDNYYEVALEWARDDFGCGVHSFVYYDWEEVEDE
jgi:hypothetical protein